MKRLIVTHIIKTIPDTAPFEVSFNVTGKLGNPLEDLTVQDSIWLTWEQAENVLNAEDKIAYLQSIDEWEWGHLLDVEVSDFKYTYSEHPIIEKAITIFED